MAKGVNKRKGKCNLSVLFVIVLLFAAALLLLTVPSFIYPQNHQRSAVQIGGYGNEMMQYWSYHDGLAQINSSQLSLLISNESRAIRSNNTLFFNGSNVKLVVLTGPMTEGQSMYSFVIDNRTNPTLEFRRGANVTLLIVNIDTDAYHSITLSGAQPPYAYYTMPMMMDSYGSSVTLPPTNGTYAAQALSFTVGGNMYYVCTVPGHAEKGMYGKIVAE